MSVIDPYRRIARVYDRLVDPMLTGVRDVAFEVVTPQSGWQVLDVGCGTGGGISLLLEAGCTVSGVDVSPAMLAIARARFGDQAGFHLVERGALPFDDDRFDMATTTMVLHEVPAQHRAGLLAEMSRVVKPAGCLLVIDYRFGSKRGWKGRLFSAIGEFVERFSGHYTGYKSFKSSGGVPSLADAAGVTIDREKIVAGGTMAIYVLTTESEPSSEG